MQRHRGHPLEKSPDQAEQEVGIKAGQEVIEDDADPALDPPVNPSDREGFPDIEKAKEEKSDDIDGNGAGSAGQGDEHAHDHIDYHRDRQ